MTSRCRPTDSSPPAPQADHVLTLPKHRAFLAALLPVIVADRVTKVLAIAHLPPGIPHEVFGDVARFTLLFNRGAAMNLTSARFPAGASPRSP